MSWHPSRRKNPPHTNRMMFKSLLNRWRLQREAWADLTRFNLLPASSKRIVFYAETDADWAYLGPISAELERAGEEIIRVVSDPNDSTRQLPNTFYVGFGGPRTALFRTIQARVFVMTLCDLDQFMLKRSVHPVHYFYVFHSIASMHRVYRLHAFDAYDTVFCVGPHHEREIRRTEEVYQLHPKRLIPHGYGRLDTLLADMEGKTATAPTDGQLRVLVAPTWGECSLVAHGLEDLLAILLDENFVVTLRLHPMTKRHLPKLVDDLQARFADRGSFTVDPHINTTQSLLDADIMISEWSGAPLDYAFSRLRPVVFVDTPPKVHNPEHGRLELPYLEEDIRTKIGRVIASNQLPTVPAVLRALVAQADEWTEKIRVVRAQSVDHVGRSGAVAAQAILDSLAEGDAPRETS